MEKNKEDKKESIEVTETYIEKHKSNDIMENKAGKTKQNKQILIAIILMLLVVAMIFLVPYVIQNYFNKFDYINLDFTKTKVGNVVFYNTLIPIVDENGKIIQDYGLDFRSDPRKLEYIEANIPTEELKVLRNVKTYISISPDIKQCEDNGIAMVSLSRFLGGFARLDVKGASTNSSYAKEFNLTYATCKTNPNNTVIVIQSDNQTKIEKTQKNCYELSYTNCEIIPVTEKFNLMILEQYMSFFERK